jgi:hypothetical protein
VGWLSDRLSRSFQTVHAIEPSKSAKMLASRNFGISDNSSVLWHSGYAENILPQIHFDGPVFFISGAVLSHLPDNQTRKVLRAFVKTMPLGSQGVFCEAWGDPLRQPMWFVRTEAWWKEMLPGFEISFFGPRTSTVRRQHMGFYAAKVGVR